LTAFAAAGIVIDLHCLRSPGKKRFQLIPILITRRAQVNQSILIDPKTFLGR
jgi:hypothetical protein